MSISPVDQPRLLIVKVLLLGECNVGKSSLMYRYAQGNFYDNRITTIGVENKTVKVMMNGRPVHLQIWDTAGQERWKHVPSSYYRNVNGIIVVYDISSQESFEKVSYWMLKIGEILGQDKLSLVLVGNKCDLDREVDEIDGKKFASDNHMLFVETSAKTNTNVDTLFNLITKDVLEKRLPIENPGQPLISQPPPQQHKSKECC